MNTQENPSKDDYDVVVIGGGSAGLSAATALARSRRSVLVVDAGEPRNAPAAAAHNVIGHEGIAPTELLALGRKEATGYGAEILSARAESARRSDTGFEIGLSGGTTVQARRLILATGLVDELPDLPGVRELWGKSVLHCPYCHGWEVRDRRIGVISSGPMSVHQTLLFRQLSDDVTFFTHSAPALEAEARDQLEARDVRIVDGTVAELRADGEEVRAVVLEDGTEVEVDAVVVAPRFVARADLYEQLGGTVTDHPVGTLIETDPTGKTALPGVWAAGNSADLSAVVVVAAGAGVMTGAAVNADLIAEETAAAVEERAARGLTFAE
ncbi:NAD(P)/FAD-dependent oxidoreductase [Rhodococcus rhodochrous]|uniref:NAD(P)/FAD-dependent oxidoreductase n=1 Tax=Rhodococcus rhodochrous TaxID=1829 RepID=UPI001E388D46|nr:NAD(P)/FAD-dependent oxidoreductase [Rhodococcus rhodochrous]MCD2096432.1 NAD(P)/FAD-dependent oxidoreductase [Rhodococcus rhodochrous]MCD2121350.1 NAD(P)/FAD-dependent oxidoreductase [Rhodococcus rhodochrous]MCQ4135439.1 NAD(P)/FAD-dependent oxidoreductase [Rhodococcus rhodochrous]MDJ0019526.1 NAD(P)/FAD-dependent oxidoreductase [Rhodococcus rhodochrous]